MTSLILGCLIVLVVKILTKLIIKAVIIAVCKVADLKYYTKSKTSVFYTGYTKQFILPPVDRQVSGPHGTLFIRFSNLLSKSKNLKKR